MNYFHILGAAIFAGVLAIFIGVAIRGPKDEGVRPPSYVAVRTIFVDIESGCQYIQTSTGVTPRMAPILGKMEHLCIAVPKELLP